jgi:hypothetical protein
VANAENPVQSLFVPQNAVFAPATPLQLLGLPQVPEEGLSRAINNLVGGYFQVIRAPHGAVMYLHEEGKLNGLPENIVATYLAHEAGLSAGDWIVGPVVLVGGPDEVGYDTAVPSALVEHVKSLGCIVEPKT